MKFRQLIKPFFLVFFIGFLHNAMGQTDSLLQTLLVDEKVDSQLVMPSKMLFTQQLLWGKVGILKNRYPNTADLVERRKIDLQIRRSMLKLHQIGGFVTLGGMVAQGIIGSQLYKGSYQLKETHERLGTAINLS